MSEQNSTKSIPSPGPWRKDKWGAVVDANGSRIEVTGFALITGHRPPHNPAYANSDLAAAAPELLEALEDVVWQIEKTSPETASFDFVNRARAAIAKAKGEQP